jgi:hypothetical protein
VLERATGARDAGSDELDPTSTSPKPVHDAVVYTVSYGGREVETDDAAMPDSLALRADSSTCW